MTSQWKGTERAKAPRDRTLPATRANATGVSPTARQFPRPQPATPPSACAPTHPRPRRLPPFRISFRRDRIVRFGERSKYYLAPSERTELRTSISDHPRYSRWKWDDPFGFGTRPNCPKMRS